MASIRTLAIDIGGTGIKAILLDHSGKAIGTRVRIATPPRPVSPEDLARVIDGVAAPLGHFDRVSVGFPGAVRNGRVLTAPNLGTQLWAGFDLQGALVQRWGKPVRVMNDADVQGFGAIQGEGVEMVLTLGTGCGTSIFQNGRIIPHLEFAHHPVRGGKTYDEYVGRAAREKAGKKKWNRRVERVISILRGVVNFDHLYIGGGNAKDIIFDLPPDVTIVPNSDGLTGGIALWLSEEKPAAEKAAAEKPKAPSHPLAAGAASVDSAAPAVEAVGAEVEAGGEASPSAGPRRGRPPKPR